MYLFIITGNKQKFKQNLNRILLITIFQTNPIIMHLIWYIVLEWITYEHIL